MLKYIRTYPLSIIMAWLSIGLVVLGIYSMFPAEWFGVVSVADNLTRFISGCFILAPSVPILYWFIKDKREVFIQKEPRTRPFLFWMGVTYFYLSIFRTLAYGLFPPVGILYLVCGLITMTIWLGVKK